MAGAVVLTPALRGMAYVSVKKRTSVALAKDPQTARPMFPSVETAPASGPPVLLQGLAQGVPSAAKAPPAPAVGEDGRPAARFQLTGSLLARRPEVLANRCRRTATRMSPTPQQLTSALPDALGKTKVKT